MSVAVAFPLIRVERQSGAVTFDTPDLLVSVDDPSTTTDPEVVVTVGAVTIVLPLAVLRQLAAVVEHAACRELLALSDAGVSDAALAA